MISYITKLALLLNEGDEIKAEVIREYIAESIEEALEEENFFSLPMNEIVNIIQKSDISNPETYSNIISRMYEVKGGDAAIILNAVEAKEATFEECIKIISSLKCSPVCVRLGDLHAEDTKQPEIDYEHTISKLEKEIEQLKKQKKTIYKPSDFVNDIHEAARQGKLTSVQYLIEQCHVNIEEKNNDGRTPLHVASYNGHIEVVKYLIEKCNVNVDIKGNGENTPLHDASSKGRIEIVRYLFEQCHANVEAKCIQGRTPLHEASKNGHIEVVRYLVEQCHANIEAQNIFGRTPLDIAFSRNETKEYLRSLTQRSV
jgi:hypothetical protein